MYNNDLAELLQFEVNLCNETLKDIHHFDRKKPVGRLRVSCSGGHTSFYLCTNDNRGKYVKVSDLKKVKGIAVYECCDKSQKKIKRFLKRSKGLLKEFDDGYWRYYEGYIHPEKLKLADCIVTDDDFVTDWIYYDYQKMEQKDRQFPTKKGDFVRSKSEVILADKLYDAGIPYRYEQIVYLENGEKVAPDFTLLDAYTRKEIYIEHFGSLDDPAYAKRTVEKLLKYSDSKINIEDNLICTFETKEFRYPFDLLVKTLSKRLRYYKFDYEAHKRANAKLCSEPDSGATSNQHTKSSKKAG